MEEGRILLDRGWKFTLNGSVACAEIDYDASAMRCVTLPHDWQIEAARDPKMPAGGSQGFYPREGIGWYRYEFTPAEELRGKVVRILFDGVQRFSTVYLNGEEIGGRMYGYVPFTVELTDKLIFGQKNVLAVKVDNSPDPEATCSVITAQQARDAVTAYCKEKGIEVTERLLRPDSTCGCDRWYSGAGIFRNVWMLVDEAVHVLPHGLLLTPNAQDGSVRARLLLDNRLPQETAITLKCAVTAPDGSKVFLGEEAYVLPCGESEQSFAFTVCDPKLWDIDSPLLYHAEISLSVGKKTFDSVSSDFGFRTAIFDADKGFLLNGQVRKLYGVDLHHDGGGAFGAAVPIKVWERRFRELKRLGCNAIRCSHNPQCEEFYELCDRMGFVVIDEIYDKWFGSGLYYQRFVLTDWRKDLRSMMRRDFNHPSIVLWSMGNEVEIQYSEAYYAFLADMCAECRAFDPARPVSEALIGYCIPGFNREAGIETCLTATVRYGEIVDVFMGNYMENFYDGLRERGLHKAFVGSEVFTYYRHCEMKFGESKIASPFVDVDEKDYVAGGFVWAGIDYIGESIGWPCHGWTGCFVDSAGFAKLRGDYMRSQWTNEPMVRIGIFDERDPWDMANVVWGFPQMSGHFHFDCYHRMLNVVVMTNCDYVELYNNSEQYAIRAEPQHDDRMAHFVIPYNGGFLKAVGFRDGKPVCEQLLRESFRPERMVMKLTDSQFLADGRDIAQIELWMLDHFDQVYETDHRKVRFTVEGPADIIGTDNGDFLTTDEVCRTDTRSLHYGHICLTLRSREEAGVIRVKAFADNIPTAELVFRSEPAK